MFSDLPQFIETVGYIGIFLIIFAETGLLVGVAFPGDTLLFSIGILTASGNFSLPLVILITTTAAIVGDSVGYFTGLKLGPKIFRKEESFFFRQSYVEKAKKFFDKYGALTILIARYVPIVRTFAPFLAGVAHMKYSTFIIFNIVGGIFWCVSVVLLGYYLGTIFPNIDVIILPIIATVTIGSAVLLGVRYFREKKINTLKK